MSLQAVAKKAGVSPSTVSRVLNDLSIVKNTTRARVMKAAAELKYHPNLHARSLARGSSRTLGIIVSNMDNPFFLDIFRTLQSDAHARGYEVVVANTDYSPDQLLSSIRLMIGWRVAGLAAIVSEMHGDLIRLIIDSHIPTVFYDVGSTAENITNVRVDYRKGMHRIVQYLHSIGHRRMAFLGHHSTLRPIDDRRQSFLETIGEFKCEAVRTVAAEDGLEGGRHAAQELLSSSERPTAIVCVNDFMAVGVLRYLRERGIRVPREISVTGFDNIRLAEFCSPSLTSVHIPRDRIGHIAFERLVAGETKSRSSARELLIDPELVVRESTGPAARG
jgi:DNA-binding LacI/PurR family transcriptional regulator